MKSLKSWLAVIVLILSSMCIGGVGAAFYIEHLVMATLDEGAEGVGPFVLSKLKRELKLTDTQLREIEPILYEGIEKNLQLRRQIAPEIRANTDKYAGKIRASLTSAQQSKFDQLFDTYVRKRLWELQGFGEKSSTRSD
jgi:hypothetical protein